MAMMRNPVHTELAGILLRIPRCLFFCSGIFCHPLFVALLLAPLAMLHAADSPAKDPQGLRRAESVLVPGGAASMWSYWDSGTAPSGAWKSEGFDDSEWKRGPAPLGYGEQGLATQLGFGGTANQKAITTWFRQIVEVEDGSSVGNLVLQLRRDDGAVIYWNGREIARSNMPAAAITPSTPAVKALSDSEELILDQFVVPAKDLVKTGRNTLAVEIHQASPSSSDLAFDLTVIPLAPGAVPPVNIDAEVRAAIADGNTAKAVELLLTLDPTTPRYSGKLVEAAESIARKSGPRDEQYWALLDKARDSAPEDMEVVYAWIRARVDARKDLPIQPKRRELPMSVPNEFRFIADTPDFARDARPLPKEKLLADVDDLELIIENCYAYADRRGANWRGALDALRVSLDQDITREVFAHRVARALTVFGDPHSRLEERTLGRGMQVRFVMVRGRLAALQPDRSGLLQANLPWVKNINDRPAAQWLAAAEVLVPQASPQFRRLLALEQLSDIRTVARELGESTNKFGITLTDDSGEKSITVPLVSARSRSGSVWPATTSSLLSDGLGYLRIAQMEGSPEFVASLNSWMNRFKDTRGLIIDVRGNGGGTQDALKTILPWLLKPGSPMKIINVAAYRLPVLLPTQNRSGFLGLNGRGLHPATSKVWSVEQKEQIEDFLGKWEPQWKLPADKFSDWHVMAITQDSNLQAGYYDKPVVVLQNEECFSATDNFLGALKGHPAVTLMGTASGGGSGRMADYALPNSRLKLTLCQMASFATTGLTYDGYGVPPDVVVEPKLSDHMEGTGDSLLEAATDLLLNAK